MNDEKADLFSQVPVPKAILSLVIPTVISQLITVVYNMADTFFIGQMNDSMQVAAATISMPVFIFLTAFANLFGLGGASLISRYLGAGDKEKARHCSAFCVWMGIAAAFIYGICIVLCEPKLLPILGASNETWKYCEQYIFWTIGVGAVPTVLNVEIAHLIRTEGYSKQAGFGIAFGGILNIVLDPVFIFGFGLEIKGAAIATMLSNFIAMMFYFGFLYYIRKNTVITAEIKEVSFQYNIPKEVVMVGLPGFIMTMMSTISNTALNHIVSGYSTKAIAGMGIAKKIDLMAYAIAQGMTQGTLPLIGYNYTSGNWKRMKKVIKTAFFYSLIVAGTGAVLLFSFSNQISQIFITDAETVEYSRRFLRIICLACPTTAVNFMAITVFQATGQKAQPLFLSLLRKGSLDVVFMIILNHIAGVNGIAWATPFADWIAFIISAFLVIQYLKNIKQNECIN